MTLHPIVQVLRKDPRYTVEAYEFVRESLAYAQEVLRWGASHDPERQERHLTGQQLCEASRVYALEQYGMLARVVLNNWGIYSTSDLGTVVYNLIDAQLMKKSPADRREDFDDLFDFEVALEQDYEITIQN
jgi:uncharacterized repeat protein (TIGR04138 family)